MNVSHIAKGPQVNRLAQVWRGFNRWRKKYWGVRILILCIIFGPDIVEYATHRVIIIDLVRIACDAILTVSEPRLVNSLARYHTVEETHRLRVLLWHEIDNDHNNLLDSSETSHALAIGLDPEQLSNSVVEADLGQLVKAAQRLELVPKAYSAQRVRRQAWYMAIGESQAMFESDRRKINDLLYSYYDWPDYAKWETWKRGALWFVGGLLRIVLVLFSFQTTGVLFPLCFLIALSVSGFFGKRQRIVGLLIGALLGTIVVLFLREPSEVRWFGTISNAACWLYGFGLICLSAVVGGWAAQIAALFRQRLVVLFAAVLLLGIVLTIWLLYFHEAGMTFSYLFISLPFSILALSSTQENIVFIAGPSLVIVGAYGLGGEWRRARMRARR